MDAILRSMPPGSRDYGRIRQGELREACAGEALREACAGEAVDVVREVFGVYEEPFIV